MSGDYVHGYSSRETLRLYDQASTLEGLLHKDIIYEAGSRVLEAGCGTGAQTVILCGNNPGSTFFSIDISADSLQKAKSRAIANGCTNVVFQQGDINHLQFPDNYFDHLFICFVLEHLANPEQVLVNLKRVLKPGGTLTVIEGDHGSALFYPESSYAGKTIDCLIRIQQKNGGDPLIGRRLFPLLKNAGYSHVSVSPRMVYADDSNTQIVDGFVRRTFNPMVEGVKEEAIGLNLINPEDWDAGIRDLYQTAQPQGVFCYTFFKGIAYK